MSGKWPKDDDVACRSGKDSGRPTSRSRSRSPTVKHAQPDSTSSAPQPRKERRLDNIELGARSRLKSMGIQMRMSGQKVAANSTKPRITVASAFNQESDEEPEEMPPEARMRMRNIGRDTPTSSGPNSFGKTKQGFSDAKKLFEKNLKEAMDSALRDD